MGEKGSLVNLKRIRERTIMTQQQVADRLGVPIGTYRNWEQLKNDPSFTRAECLAGLFDCTLRDFYSVDPPFGQDFPSAELPPVQDLDAVDDAVNRPAHYTSGRIEVIDFIEDKLLGFNLGNVVKYVARAGKKDPLKTREDLEKARWYLNREIERMKQDEDNQTVCEF
jgi:transcriptional regulator with XRE-family HTH domain